MGLQSLFCCFFVFLFSHELFRDFEKQAHAWVDGRWCRTHAVEGEGGAVERGVGSVSVEAPREPRPSKEP